MRYTSALACLSLVLLAAGLSFAGPAPTISVGIFSGRRPAACAITGHAAMKIDTGGADAADAAAGATLRLVANGDQVKVEGIGAGAKCTISSAEPLKVTVNGSSRAYRGAVIAMATGGRLVLVNVLPLEDYLRGVVPAEMPPKFSPEAIKAQAIAARTFALSRLGAHKDGGYDLCDSVHCQVYLGVRAEDPRVDAAVAETVGEIITYEGKLIDAVYHDSCGGMTASNEDVWRGRAIPYLRSVSDRVDDATACAKGPHATWTRKASQAAVATALASYGVTGPLRAIVPQACADGERAKGYKFIAADDREWVVYAAEVRTLVDRALGGDTLPSADFTASIDNGTITFTGRGAGHGVGLCQWGANGLAAAGHNATEILTHYYTGVTVQPMSTQLAQGEGR